MLLLLPLILGALGVLQNTLNRRFAPALGLDWALLVNGGVVFACGVLFLFAMRLFPAESLPPMYRPVPGARGFEPYDILPGLFGFFIIAGMPWAIERVGATRVFIGIIAAQLVVSLLWDFYVEGIRVGFWRIAGGALALAGTALAQL
ncbi:MAG: DMT family transporter [Bdellovibrionota bacterium]